MVSVATVAPLSAMLPAVTPSEARGATPPMALPITTLLPAPPLALTVSILDVLSLLTAPTRLIALALPLAVSVASAPSVSVPL